MINLYTLAFLTQGDRILLLRRCNATFANGQYCLPGGKVEPGETARQAVAREIQEEVSLDIPSASFELVHTFHRQGPSKEALIALVFRADIANLQPRNVELEKHDDMQYFSLDQLPATLIPAHQQAIECIRENISYSEHGW